MEISLRPLGDAGLTVLALGAHADDIEIGCGGTILTLLREREDVTVHWVVMSGAGPRSDEARRSAARFLSGAREADVRVHGFRDGFLPWAGGEVKEVFEGLKATVPDVVFTHCGSDRHQDHRLLSELTWNTFRRHTILEYEVPKYDGDLGSPNVFAALDDEVVQTKIDILMEEFPSQREKGWFSPSTFRGLMRIRGIESPQGAAAAEAFYARKMGLGLG